MMHEFREMDFAHTHLHECHRGEVEAVGDVADSIDVVDVGAAELVHLHAALLIHLHSHLHSTEQPIVS